MDLIPIHFRPLLSPPYYLDPGSGSLIIQLLLGALFAAGLATRLFWRKIKAFFSGKPAESATSTPEKEDGKE